MYTVLPVLAPLWLGTPSMRRDIGRGGGDPGRCRVVPAVLRLERAGPVPP